MNAMELAEKILGYLTDLRGFDAWWGSLSGDQRRAIKADLADNLEFWMKQESERAKERA